MTEHRAQYDTAPVEPETIGEILPDATQAALAAFRPRTHYDGCYRVHPECALAKIQEIENERDAANQRSEQSEIKFDNLRASFIELYNAIREYKVKRYSHPLSDPTGKKYEAQAMQAEDDLFYTFDKYAVPNGVVENKFEKRDAQIEAEARSVFQALIADDAKLALKHLAEIKEESNQRLKDARRLARYILVNYPPVNPKNKDLRKLAETYYK